MRSNGHRKHNFLSSYNGWTKLLLAEDAFSNYQRRLVRGPVNTERRGSRIYLRLLQLPTGTHFMPPGKTKQKPWSKRLKKVINRRMPITSWLAKYTKDDVVGDIIAGVTIALTITPQSIAYASLAGVDPQYGLNSAFMGSIVYVFFGTVREIMIGPSSLMSLLTLQFAGHLNIDFVVLLSFLCGIVEMLMGLLNLGSLVSCISAPVVSGFTSATALIVIISQIKGLLGLTFKSADMVDTFKKIILNWGSVRAADATLGVTCMICLLLLRQLKELKVSSDVKGHRFINGSFWFISTGRNALIVLVTSLISLWYINTEGKPPFMTTKPIDSGIPKLLIPPMRTEIGNKTYEMTDMVVELGMGPLIIPVVAILANVAIAKVYATKTIDATQEIVALSLCNIAGSFFQSIPSTGAFTRSAVISASGVRTPIIGLYSAALVLLALQYLSPFFYLIPRATLSAVLIAAVAFLVDWGIFKPLWKSGAKKELAMVVVTGIVCIIVRVELGLLFGVVIELCSLIYKWARPKITTTKTKTSIGEYVTIRPELDLYFPSVDYLSAYVIKVGDQNKNSPIILDCKEVKRADYSTAKGLAILSRIFSKRRQTLAFLDVRPKCQTLWVNTGCDKDMFWLSEDILEKLHNPSVGGENSIPLSEIHAKDNDADGDHDGATDLTNIETVRWNSHRPRERRHCQQRES